MSILCYYKKHRVISFFLGWFIIYTIIAIILSCIGSKSITTISPMISVVYSMVYIYIVFVYKDEECKSERAK